MCEMKRWTHSLRQVLLACLVCVTAGAKAGDTTIRIMVSGIEKQIYIPVVLAERLGYFTAQGLDVRLLTEPSGVNAEDELVAGAVQAVVGFYDHTIDLQSKGKYVQAVVQFSRAPGEVELVSTRIADSARSIADLKGRSLGVTGLGSSTHLLTRYLLAAQGVSLDQVRVTAVGGGAGFAAALRDGRIDAGMTTQPTAAALVKSGDARMLIDLRTPAAAERALGGPYPGACLYLTTLWIETHRPQVQRLAAALVKALRYMSTHSAEDIAAQMPSTYFHGDRPLYVQALAESQAMFIADGVMPATGPTNVLRVMQAVNRRVQRKPIDLRRTYAPEFTAQQP